MQLFSFSSKEILLCNKVYYKRNLYILPPYQTHSMVYSISIVQCTFVMYVLEDVLHLVEGHNTKYKIDEFIDKLLISQKFDELAEKIADKAVEKILNLHPNLRITDGSIMDENTQKTQENAQRNETHESILQNVEDKEISLNISNNEADENFQSKSTSRKRLSLKYVHFTKGPIDSKDSEDDADSKTKKQDETGSDISKETQNKSKEQGEETSKESNKKADTERNENKIENTNTKTIDVQKIREKSQDEKGDETHYSNEKDGSISLENKKNILEMMIESGSNDHESNSDLHKYGDQSEFETKLERDRHLFENEYTHSSQGNESKKKRKKRIHREGKRLYTFLSSSDYDEYHRELEKEEKERTVFI